MRRRRTILRDIGRLVTLLAPAFRARQQNDPSPASRAFVLRDTLAGSGEKVLGARLARHQVAACKAHLMTPSNQVHSDALRCTQMHSDALRCTQMHSDALRCTQWPQAKRTSRGTAIQIWSSAIKGNQGRSHLARRGHTDLALLGYAGLPRCRFPFHSRHGALILREPLLALFLGLGEA